jgi:hypothetical protein
VPAKTACNELVTERKPGNFLSSPPLTKGGFRGICSDCARFIKSPLPPFAKGGFSFRYELVETMIEAGRFLAGARNDSGIGSHAKSAFPCHRDGAQATMDLRESAPISRRIPNSRFLAGARNDTGRRSSPRTLIRGPTAEPSLARLEQDFVQHRF